MQRAADSAPPPTAQDDAELGPLDARHLRAISLLTEGMTLDEVAKEIGCGRRTLYRWRTSPLFAAALAEAASRGLGAALDRLRCLREAALDVLERLLSDAKAPAQVRLAAAREVMERTGLVAAAGRGAADDERPATTEETEEALRIAGDLLARRTGR